MKRMNIFSLLLNNWFIFMLKTIISHVIIDVILNDAVVIICNLGYV